MEKGKRGPESENSKMNAAGKNANAPRDGGKTSKGEKEKKGFTNEPPKHQNL